MSIDQEFTEWFKENVYNPSEETNINLAAEYGAQIAWRDQKEKYEKLIKIITRENDKWANEGAKLQRKIESARVVIKEINDYGDEFGNIANEWLEKNK